MNSSEIRAEIESQEETLRAERASKLVKYVKRSGEYKGEITTFTKAQYRELMGKPAKKAIINKAGYIPWELALDEVATELGYRGNGISGDEALKKAIEKCIKISRRIEELKHDLLLAKEKEAKGLKATRTKKATEACRKKDIHGEWCKSYFAGVNGTEIIAVHHPSNWSIHVVKEGKSPTEDNKAGDIRYAKEAQKAITEIKQGLTKQSRRATKSKKKKR